ncbi:hypothetical protein CI109_100152 [Kwoniella shandongensis]|uniref:Uncharacterized protein n=1 Tax=Kwoniella shandongensis TaxID=1734106 RepID=A0A5M6BXY6_9TREE|nr:uncharacterized protein CI109_005750 [Kwoniella shandongensis]KAA5525869.1 hypothetical protein CI109_005750 [Kwoniella shandongensis]
MTTHYRSRPFLFSIDKENTPSLSLPSRELPNVASSLSGAVPSSSSSRSKKSTTVGGLGIGRAPKYTTAGRRGSNKPYSRISSVQRAKKAANKAYMAKSIRKGDEKRKVRRAESELNDVERAKALRAEQERTMLRERTERWRNSVWRSGKAIPGNQVRIPLQLPCPILPPVPSISTKELNDVPPAYILHQLRPLLSTIARTAFSYKQHAEVAHPDPSIDPRTTIAFRLPELLEKQLDADPARRFLEADMALCVLKKGREEEGVKFMIPVSSLVWASQCCFWQDLVVPHFRPVAASSQLATQTSTQNEKSQVGTTPLAPINEADEDVDTDADSDTEVDDSSIYSSASESSSWSSTTSTTNTESTLYPDQFPAPLRDGSYLHLPLAQISLPSPETFLLLLHHLHHPSRPIILDLLGNALPETTKSRSDVLDVICNWSVQHLMDKLEVVQGFWQNLVCLGIGNKSTWRQMGEVWACLVGTIAGKGMMLNDDKDKIGERPQGERLRSAAEEVAWELVRREREK